MSREYCDYILDQLAPLPGISAKRMFGGFGLFRQGLMFGIIIDDVLYYKTAASNRADYEAAGSEPFQYEAKKKTVTLSYWTVPAVALDYEDPAGMDAGRLRRCRRSQTQNKEKSRKNKTLALFHAITFTK